MIFITDESDFNLNDDNIALYFYASWMVFHNKIIIMINKIEEKYKDKKFYAIDIDHFTGLIKRFDIKSIPTFLIKKPDKELKKIEGLLTTAKFMHIFTDIYGS